MAYRKNHSMFYAGPSNPNKFPGYTTADLHRDLDKIKENPSVAGDAAAATMAKLETEIARRAKQ